MAYENYRYKRKKAQCSLCPLDGGCKVWGLSGIQEPPVVLLGESPGEVEDAQGEPFVGPAGKWLRKAIKFTDLPYYSLHKTNVISCRPPGNNIESSEGWEAKEHCRPGLLQELKDIGPKVIVPLGSHATHALGIEGSISKVRGSIYPLKWVNGKLHPVEEGSYDVLAVPTFHPSFIMRGQIKQESTWVNDLIKAFELVTKKYKPPRENFKLFPTAAEIVETLNWLAKEKKRIGVDIEATSLIAHRAELIVTGIAWSGEDAISVPHVAQYGKQLWKPSDEKKINAALRKVLKVCPTVFQNALYDTRVLEAQGFPVENVEHDILLLDHAINPELPHGLGQIVSRYGNTPFWKDAVVGNATRMIDTDPRTLRLYNARDAVVLLQCLDPMLKDLKKFASPKVYHEISIGLIPPCQEMMNNGLPISKSRLQKFRSDVQADVETVDKQIHEEFELPATFNLSSGAHIRWLLYGIEPPNFKKKKQQLAEYTAPGSNKKTNTKAYRKLLGDVEAIRQTKPLIYVVKPAKTESGQSAIDKQQMMRLTVALNNRLNEIENLKRKTKKHEDEKRRLYQLQRFIELFHRYQDRSKVLSTYTSYEIGPDGRVHFPYKIHGTYTGRLASGDKKKLGVGNAQNIPYEARKLFKAGEGWKFLQADYSNLELRVLAYVSEDDVLLKAFADYDAGNGDKPHAVNAKNLFNIDESHPDWKSRYNLAKRYIFGRNYGGSLRGIYEKIMQEDPTLTLTFNQFKEIDRRYRSLHPQYDKWYNETVNTVKKTRKLTNAFGRVRYFQGQENEIVREGLNFPIQSVAADVMNYALIELYRKVHKRDDCLLMGMVHDSVLLEVKEEALSTVAPIVRTALERTFNIFGHKVSFPIDVEVGDDWYNVEEWTG